MESSVAKIVTLKLRRLEKLKAMPQTVASAFEIAQLEAELMGAEHKLTYYTMKWYIDGAADPDTLRDEIKAVVERHGGTLYSISTGEYYETGD